MNYAIIAAGEGSRLAQEGVAKPKPLVELNGVPMVKRLIDIFTRCNAETISIIVNQEMTEVRDFLMNLKTEVPLNIVVRSTPSSMHSFYWLSKVMKPGKFVLTTVDTIFREQDFAEYVAAFEKAEGVDGMMAITPFIEDEKPLYVATDDSMKIIGFLDAPAEGVKYVSGGVYGLTDPCREVLNRCIEGGISRMRNYQRALIEDGLDIRGFAVPKIIDVDHASDIETAEKFISE